MEEKQNILLTGKADDDPEDNELAQLQWFTERLEGKYESRATLRAKNLEPQRPKQAASRCETSVKKNTAFVKRLKQFTASQTDAILKDMYGLNLSKYITEVSAALVEAKLKMSDINAAVSLSCELHQLYPEFAGHFYENWQKILHIKPGEKIGNPSKMRVDLRFYSELVSAGIFTNKVGLPLLGAVLTALISQDKEEHNNLSIILSFCKHCGDEYAGLVPKGMADLARKNDIVIPMSNLLPPDKQTNLRSMLKDYYLSLAEHLQAEHKQLQDAEKSKRRMLETKGEISVEKKEQIEMLQSTFNQLHSSTAIMADLLGEELPELAIEVEQSPTEGMVIDVGEVQLSTMDPWRDEETKSFYVDLPDLRQFLPNYSGKREETPVPDELPISEDVLDMDVDVEQDADDGVLTDSAENSEAVELTAEEAKTAPSTPHHHANREYFEQYIQNLQNCVNRELIDNAAIDFLLNLNTKNNRKRLAKVLFGVHRTRLDLLPLYARLVAIINLVSSDIASDLCQMLKYDFKYHIKKKDQINIETKIKVVRFIGELVKFGIYYKTDALYCLLCLLQSFQHHQIEMTCAFLEVCGIYLYNSPESRLRTNVILEQMMRLKTNTAMDTRYTQQVENCYYLIKQPDGVKNPRKIRPVMHMYIRRLIFEELNKSNVEKIIHLLRRLNWDEKDTHDYAVKCLSKAYNIRYHVIRSLADLVSGLSSYQERVIVKVIDAVFEDIRAGLEIHDTRLAQRRLAMVKYLGELYNYRLVEYKNIINTLYSIITVGVATTHEMPSDIDPPGSFFRLKLVCVLLDTCGEYFTDTQSRRALDCFIVFFQQYYWFKKSDPYYRNEPSKNLFPILIDHMYKECLKNLRPRLKLVTSYEKAKSLVYDLRKKLYPGLDATWADDSKAAEVVETDRDTITEEYTSEAVGESDSGDENDQPRVKCDEDEKSDNDRVDDAELGEIESEVRPMTPPMEKSAEDLEFEREFERMSLESYQERLKDTTLKVSTKNIPVPITVRNGSKKTYDQLQESKVEKPSDSMNFVLMLRSKGKQHHFKTFEAPCDSELVKYVREQEQKLQEEKDNVKRLTLNISERLEEEDYQESLLQHQRASQNNKTRVTKSTKFKHPKGAPDVDSIFH